MSHRFCALIAGLLLLFTPRVFSAPVVFDEAESNDPCINARFMGEVSLPYLIEGSLGSTELVSDVDFYRVTGAPGQRLDITIEGAGDNMQTLDPYLGFFNPDCELLVANDDHGGLNSRLVVTVPANGEYVLGVTHCCDIFFTGGGSGGYTMKVGELAAIDSIVGRVVDAWTLQPLPGDADPWAWVTLYACTEYGCGLFMNSQSVASDGSFLFTKDAAGFPLTPGAYLVEFSAQSNAWCTYGPFEVQEGDWIDLGDLDLSPVEVIGAISGPAVRRERRCRDPG